MSDLRERIKEAQKTYMKSKDTVKLSAVRLIMATLKDRDIGARVHNKPDGIDDPEILSMLQGMIKQRNDSIKMYMDGGRPELADREASEIAVIEGFLPKQMSGDEIALAIKGIVKETGADGMKDMGKVMAVLKEKYAGQMDMSKASQAVKDALAA